MQIVLIGKNYINKLLLPQNVVGTYWISDKIGSKEKKLINIEAYEDMWILRSNRYTKFFEMHNYGASIQWEKAEEITLKEYETYGVKFGDSEDMYTLFCIPVYENYTHYNIKNTNEITIGSGMTNNIVCKNPFISNFHAKLYFDGTKWLLENYSQQYDVFVNGRPRHKLARTLRNGDIVFIMGLKIILMGNSIYINNPRNECICNANVLELTKENEIIIERDVPDDIDDEDYFSRAPRLTDIIEKENVKIDAPPVPPSKDEMPMILVLGTSFTMGVIMLFSVIRSIDGYLTGTLTAKQMMFSMIPSIALLISIVLFPVLSRRYEKKRKIENEEKRQSRYKEYLKNKNEKINQIREKQKKILLKNYLSAKECEDIILRRDNRLWERQIEDYDFLTLRLGLGKVPLQINLQHPEEKFSMEDDNLIDILNQIAENSKNIEDAPVTISLAEKNISAIISKGYGDLDKYLKELIIQLIAFHSSEDLKLIFFLQKDNLKKWEYVKMLPHVWDAQKEIRFFAESFEEMTEISKYLSEIINARMQSQNKSYKSFAPYYLIITEFDKQIEGLKIVEEVLNAGVNVGFSMLCLMDDLGQLPNECSAFVNIEENKGIMFESQNSTGSQREFTFNTTSVFHFEEILQSIANIPMKYFKNGGNLLPSQISFLEMFDVGRIEQLNILERWSRNDPTVSLKAPIGVDRYGMPIVLDIHENAHGPHGLIAGSTGSGKSEFIITYILSLAVNYHPEDVTFILIDYKGGSLSGAFCKRGIRLPHLVGTITNIDTAELQRSLVSIQSELKRRQIIFNEARELTDEGTIDIYKYQKLYHNGVVRTPVSHLVIICDEFAELKQQQPDFMDELMSVARIGRSLGVHLILATQKPAGIVNDQIRSNSKFAICLKVQDRSDSMDVIKKPDAASLKRVGQFYMQIGYDEYFVLGQSAWTGAPYFPSDRMEESIDDTIEFLSNTGDVFYTLTDEKKEIKIKQGEQLTNIVRYLSETSNSLDLKVTNLWKDSIPKDIYLSDIKEKYRVKKTKNEVDAVIGEYDDPANQSQGVVKIDISNNMVVYGNAESGKETLLSTMIFDLITTYTPSELQTYIFDFGSESLKTFRGAPNVGDVVFLDDEEKINRFFGRITREMQERKAILSNYNGDYNLYMETTGNNMPMILVIMNNFESFIENYQDEYEETLLILTRECVKYRISFAFTVSSYSVIRYRLTQNLKQKIALQLNRADDYLNVFENLGKRKISNIFGRGFIGIEGNIYEFQTAKVCDAEEYTTFVRGEIDKLNQIYIEKAEPIDTLPKQIKIDDIKDEINDLSDLPIGIAKKDLKTYKYNFRERLIHLILSKNVRDAAQFTGYILDEMQLVDGVRILLLDTEKILDTNNLSMYEEFEKMVNDLESLENERAICVIIGADKFINNYRSNDGEFYDALMKIEVSKNCNIILVESDTKIKSHEYSDWYRAYVSKENAIWVGNGIENQYAINIMDTSKLRNKCGASFGYAVKDGNATLIKLLEMKEGDAEDE